MKLIVVSLALSLCATSALAAGTACVDRASDKNLAGAALKSFMTKCEKDAKAACDVAAQDKQLSGAAKVSFTKKCVKDAVGTTAPPKN